MINKKAACIAMFTFVIMCFFAEGGLSKEIESKDASIKVNQIKNEKPKPFTGIEFLTGYGLAKLHSQGSYRITPLFIDLDVNLKPSLPRKLSTYPGLVQFVYEPFVSYAFQPDTNIEVGNNFLLKIVILPETSRFQPYLKGGVGFLYMSQHSSEQSTQFNFNEYGGIGMHYFFKKDIAFTLEYRYRHISNGDIKRPNSGINSNFVLCGVSLLF